VPEKDKQPRGLIEGWGNTFKLYCISTVNIVFLNKWNAFVCTKVFEMYIHALYHDALKYFNG
jgi:hypothetical protein